MGADALAGGVDEEAAQEVNSSGGGIGDQLLQGGRLSSPERDLGVIGELRQLLADLGGRRGGSEATLGRTGPPQCFPLDLQALPVCPSIYPSGDPLSASAPPPCSPCPHHPATPALLSSPRVPPPVPSVLSTTSPSPPSALCSIPSPPPLLPALPVPPHCFQPSQPPPPLPPALPVPPTALSPPSSPQIPHCPPLTGHTRGLGVPRARSTQHSCSMSFSPGKRGDRLSSSPKMQPTALRMSTQGGHHHGGGDTPIFGDIHSGDTNVEHKFGGMNSGIQI